MSAADWVDRLEKWFTNNQRSLPWRAHRHPYHVWISEMMLQQTQVATMLPYYERFLDAFPTVNELASAEQEQVLKLWEGLGYYARARNLHKAAKIIVNDYDGELPESYDELQKLPGVGPYIAAAVTSIAFNNPIPVVDGNVLRVFSRFWGSFEDIRSPKVRTVFFNKLKKYIQYSKPSDFNQAMMECGALICKPVDPSCDNCPLSSHCFAYKSQKVNELPVKSKQAKVPHYDIVIGIIKKNQKILITKRKQDQLLGGLWEFPGGKIEKNETEQIALKREILEETNLKVKGLSKLATVKHAYSHFKITMHAYLCDYESGNVKISSADDFKWVLFEELTKYPFPKANIKILKSLTPIELSLCSGQ